MKVTLLPPFLRGVGGIFVCPPPRSPFPVIATLTQCIYILGSYPCGRSGRPTVQKLLRWLISSSSLTVTTPKWQGAYYKKIGRVADPSVTGIGIPEPAWLREKLPVNNCLQNLVSLLCYTSQVSTREKKTRPPPHPP
jgi:hypothetical protein